MTVRLPPLKAPYYKHIQGKCGPMVFPENVSEDKLRDWDPNDVL
jgi:hypothetical protein